MNLSIRRCANCTWWEHVGELEGNSESFGLCHFNPPVAHGTEDLPPWPFTDSDDWCRECTPRES